jgi:YihY family inner membrane protein
VIACGLKAAVKKLDCYQRTHDWLAVPVATVKKFGDDDAGSLAALVAYYAFFSLFPLLLALVTILGFLLHGDPGLQRRILDSALANFPIVGDQIRTNIGSLRGNWLALVVGLAGALWAGMGAMDAAQHALNSVWDVRRWERPAFVVRKLRSLLMLVVIADALFVNAASATVVSAVDSVGVPGRIVAPLLSTAVNIGVFLVAFKLLTQRDLHWSDVAPGAVVAGLATTVFQVVGGYIIARSLRGASPTYGTFAAVIGLLSWLHLQAKAILFAAEINVVLSGRLWPRGLVTDADELDRTTRVRGMQPRPGARILGR